MGNKKSDHLNTEMVPAHLTTYGLSHELSPEDSRQVEWKEQRAKYGFDMTEMWCLSSAMAKFMLPRLKDFKEYASAGWTAEGLNDLDKIIRAFELVVEDKMDYRFEKTADGKAFQEGWNLFHELYLSLWC